MPLKLLDYGKISPFGEIIGRPRSLAWPASVYRVTLPKVSEDGDSLNPFERVILKIIDAGGAREEEALARETCIHDSERRPNVSFIQCVLLRLRDKGFIDEYNNIINARRERWKATEEKPPEFITALLFRELATGKILPFLHFLDDNDPLKKKERCEWPFCRICDYDHKNNPPLPRDIISALRAMKKRSMAFGDETRLPAPNQITIFAPEQYYLDCPIAILKSDGEFRIADPFGKGFSRVLENAFSILLGQDNILRDWMMDWRRNLSKTRQDMQVEILKEPFDSDSNRERYPKLISNLRKKQYTQHRSIEQIYAALEWALFYYCTRQPYNNAVNQLILKNQSEHAVLLEESAKKVGLNLPQYGFSPVRVGKIDDFLSGEADMETVLSIALLIAADEAAHPLRGIAAKHQDFIIRIFDIKKPRSEQGHGKGKVQKNEIELPEEAFMRKIVTALLPAIQFSDAPVAEVDKEAVSDLLLDARTSIQSEFGFRLFNRLGVDLQDRLIYAERFWLFCKDGDDALTFARDIYAALQRVFRQKLSGVLPPDIKDSEFSVTAQKKATDSRLGQLPECLRTVKARNDQTLGACVLAFLLVSDTDTLCSIADTQPSFISDLADIINCRGHGNEPLPLSKGDIGKLRKSTYSTIKTLLEA